jgi:hypothetical protein
MNPFLFIYSYRCLLPGYLKCCQWLAEIWSNFDQENIKQSFIYCGIRVQRQYPGEVVIKWDTLHSVLRGMLSTQKVFTHYFDNFDNFDYDDMFNENAEEILDFPENFLVDTEMLDETPVENEPLDELFPPDQSDRSLIIPVADQNWRILMQEPIPSGQETSPSYVVINTQPSPPTPSLPPSLPGTSITLNGGPASASSSSSNEGPSPPPFLPNERPVSASSSSSNEVPSSSPSLPNRTLPNVIITPQLILSPKVKRLRRTKVQIAAGITLDEVRKSKEDIRRKK